MKRLLATLAGLSSLGVCLYAGEATAISIATNGGRSSATATKAP